MLAFSTLALVICSVVGVLTQEFSMVLGCTSDSDCNQGQICENTKCLLGCRADTDCDFDKACINNRCIDVCRSDQGCLDDEICSSGQCRKLCMFKNTCGTRAICIASAHRAECSCPTGHTGNPIFECRRIEGLCETNADCPSGKVCINKRCEDDVECRSDEDCNLGNICQRNKCLGNNNTACPYYQTECTFGCCPFAEGVCCIDGFECCQHGQTCIPYIGLCLSLVEDEKDGTSLIFSKSTPVENLITICPPGTTTCGVDKCCRYDHATCCSDGEHCCPNGYKCDLPNKLCIKGTFRSLLDISRIPAVPVAKSIKKSPYKTCPGNNKICPSYSSCCVTDDGQWDCCPNLSIGQLKVAIENKKFSEVNYNIVL